MMVKELYSSVDDWESKKGVLLREMTIDEDRRKIQILSFILTTLPIAL